jgi:hypothetical protein
VATNGDAARFPADNHTLVDRKGGLWVGRVLNSTLEIEVHGTAYSFEISLLWSVIYKNPPYFLEDEMRFVKPMVLQGPVTTTPIRFETAGRVIEFPREDVLHIGFGYAGAAES